MRKVILLLTCLVIITPFLISQSVDSIRLEQSGDMIKVHYKIAGSNSNQVFRVSVLCSINGGLKSQLNSLSGDFGENIIGGRDGYMILWDVLKDIDELNSAEFFIKAELVKNLSVPVADNRLRSKVKGKFYFLLGFETPGPKGGFRVGYMGSYGVSAGLNYGSIPILKKYENNVYYTGFDPGAGIGLDVSKRIINLDNFQLHLIAGFRETDLSVYASGLTPPQFWTHGMGGIETGIIFSIKRIAACVTVSHFFPKQADRQHEEPVVLTSPKNLIDVCIGINF